MSYGPNVMSLHTAGPVILVWQKPQYSLLYPHSTELETGTGGELFPEVGQPVLSGTSGIGALRVGGKEVEAESQHHPWETSSWLLGDETWVQRVFTCVRNDLRGGCNERCWRGG